MWFRRKTVTCRQQTSGESVENGLFFVTKASSPYTDNDFWCIQCETVCMRSIPVEDRVILHHKFNIRSKIVAVVSKNGKFQSVFFRCQLWLFTSVLHMRKPPNSKIRPVTTVSFDILDPLRLLQINIIDL